MSLILMNKLNLYYLQLLPPLLLILLIIMIYGGEKMYPHSLLHVHPGQLSAAIFTICHISRIRNLKKMSASENTFIQKCTTLTISA